MQYHNLISDFKLVRRQCGDTHATFRGGRGVIQGDCFWQAPPARRRVRRRRMRSYDYLVQPDKLRRSKRRSTTCCRHATQHSKNTAGAGAQSASGRSGVVSPPPTRGTLPQKRTKEAAPQARPDWAESSHTHDLVRSSHRSKPPILPHPSTRRTINPPPRPAATCPPRSTPTWPRCRTPGPAGRQDPPRAAAC